MKIATKKQLFDLMNDPVAIMTALGADPRNVQMSFPVDPNIKALHIAFKTKINIPDPLVMKIDGEDHVIPLEVVEYQHYSIGPLTVPNRNR